MALSQPQFKAKTLIEMLESNGSGVGLSIHPVVGRMPGHRNVLLAEADGPYDRLFEMEEMKSEF